MKLLSDRNLGHSVELGEGEPGIVLVIQMRLIAQQIDSDCSPSSMPCWMSCRQWMPAKTRPKPTFDASLLSSPPTVNLIRIGARVSDRRGTIIGGGQRMW